VEDIDFWMNFVVVNSKKLQKWVWKETSIEPSMCSQCRISNFSIPKMWKLINVFTLGPITLATLLLNHSFWNQGHGDLLWAMILILSIINILVHECLFVTCIFIILVLFRAFKTCVKKIIVNCKWKLPL
jgi:hypothetical protein